MFKNRPHLKTLLEKKFGYIMLNEENNVEIKCTPEYKNMWADRGFKVIHITKDLRLIG